MLESAPAHGDHAAVGVHINVPCFFLHTPKILCLYTPNYFISIISAFSTIFALVVIDVDTATVEDVTSNSRMVVIAAVSPSRRPSLLVEKGI
jgi:hypothetical protein